ncbi:lamin tail domain-containing protein [bacterium]|nr:lamin tail domain-containing protein [bacterium]
MNNNIVDLEYNPPGKRDRSKLNEEYVEIKNIGEELQDFAGWTLEDKAGHKFYFSSRRKGRISWCSVLKPGESMKVYTGSGTNERYGTKRYFNYRMPIWNNIEGDRATLRDNTGKVIAQYTYKLIKIPHRKLKEPKTLIRNNKTKETHLSGKDACYWVSLIRDASTITGTVPTCYFCAAWYEKKIEITYKWLEGEAWREEKEGPFYEKWEE